MKGRIHKPVDAPDTKKLPIIGRLKIGEKVAGQNGKEYPRSLDYFRATGDYAKLFHETFGDKPSNVGIVFIFDDANEVCNERYELRDKKTGNLLGSGDGLTFKLWRWENAEKKKGKYIDFINDSPEKKAELDLYTKEMANGEKWRGILTARFIIPKLSKIMGHWQLETKGSASSIKNISDTFDMVQETAGTVVNIPFDLTVKKVTSQVPGEKTIYPVVALIPNISNDKMQDVHQFLSQGNSMRDLRTFLSDVPQETKQITQPEQKQLPQAEKAKAGSKVSTVKQSDLFNTNGTN